MNKNALCLTSLVAAVPGAWLAVLMVMAFISYAGGWSFLVKGVAGILLLVGGMLAVMPIAIFVLAGPRAAKAAKKESAVAAIDEPAPAEGEDFSVSEPGEAA